MNKPAYRSIVDPGSVGFQSPPEVRQIPLSIALADPLRIIADTTGDFAPDDPSLGVAITELHFEGEVGSLAIDAKIVRDLRRPTEHVFERLRTQEGQWIPFLSEKTRAKIRKVITDAILKGEL